MITITQKHLKKGHRVRPGTALNYSYITVHSTGNATSTADGERRWLDNPDNKREASWHLVIDQKECIEAIPLNEVSWHAGSGNSKSIGIEICESGDRKKTLDRAAQLCAQLLKAKGWDTSRLNRHYDWTQKNCPQILSANKWAGWNDFVKQVDGYLKPKTAKTAIMGQPIATVEQMIALMQKYNPNPGIKMDLTTFCNTYINEGKTEDVRGDIAFAQAIYETGWFKYGGTVKKEHYNYAGFLSNGKSMTFKDEKEGIRAHIQHLKNYASKEPLKNPCVDKKYSTQILGTAPNVQDLDGKWCVPGVGYGDTIMSFHKKITDMPKPAEPTNRIKIIFNGNVQYVDGFIEDGRTYLQMRAFGDLVGASVDFKDNKPYLNGKPVSVPYLIREGRTYIQIRDICTSLGYEVGFADGMPTISYFM